MSYANLLSVHNLLFFKRCANNLHVCPGLARKRKVEKPLAYFFFVIVLLIVIFLIIVV